jgi:segregation and condensation protein B
LFGKRRSFAGRDRTAIGWRSHWKRRPSPVSKDHEGSASTASPEIKLTRVEAILFLAREPLGSRKLAQFAGLADGTEARTIVRRLNRQYDEEGAAFRAEEVAGGFQLLTRPKFGSWLRRVHRNAVEGGFSAPALETLAVVAYRQPVLRADVEAIRGVDCGEILRQLMDRDLVRIVGRSQELGRPILYGITKRFLQVFGLRGLEDLPRAAELRSSTVEAKSAVEPKSAVEARNAVEARIAVEAKAKSSAGESRRLPAANTASVGLDQPAEESRTLAEP